MSKTEPPVLILTHGAGSHRDAPLLVALDAALTAAGWTVRRVNLAFREARPGGPPRPADAERDRQGLREAVASARSGGATCVALGGHSYGGRQATLLAAGEPGLADALLLLSYPLHPPRRPEELRTAHLPGLRTPALFLHGARDPFGSLEEMTAAVALLPARSRLVGIEGAGHELAAPARRAAVAARIANEWLRFLAEGPPPK
jgi:predicted alpha/beta-hydrolase family hydrolase